jgi:hypothetical protein
VRRAGAINQEELFEISFFLERWLGQLLHGLNEKAKTDPLPVVA